MTPVLEGLERAQEVLFNQGILLHLYVGKWTGNKKLRPKDLLIDTIDPAAFYPGHKKLLPPTAQRNLQQLEGAARRYLDAHSIDFPIGKAKYIYYRSLPKVIEELRRYKSQWDVEVETLIAGYPRFQEEQLVRLDAQAHSLVEEQLARTAPTLLISRREELKVWEEEQKRINRELYPNVDTLRARYAFEWRLFRVSALEGVNNMNLLDQDTIIQAQESMRRDFQNWVREASQGIHQELGEAAANARRLLEANGRLNARSLRPLFEAFETFQSVSFAQNSEFQQAIDRIRQSYLQQDVSGSADFQRTAETVNNSPEELRQLLGTLSRLSVDQVAQEAGINAVRAGEFGRLLDV